MKPAFLARKRLFFWSPLLLAGVAFLCTDVCIWTLYHEAVKRQKTHLARELAEQVDALEDFGRTCNWDTEKTLKYFRDARGAEHDVVGDTGEFVIAERDGNSMRFLFRSRSPNETSPSVPFESDLVEPLRRALSGQTGTMFATDCRGKKVFAAYSPVPHTPWGFIVKIEAAEVWAPALNTTVVLGAITLVLVVVGSVLIMIVGRPLIQELESQIVEHQQAEEKLEQSCTQLQTICDEMVEGLSIVDVETKQILSVNASYCRMTGYSQDELQGMSFTDMIPPENVEEELRQFAAIASGETPFVESRPVSRKDKSVLYADITGHPILYNGRPCVFAMLRDMTERRNAEQELIEARRVAEAANRAKSEFLANMSHEIRTPMTAILGYADGLVELSKDPEIVEAVQIIRRSSRHLLAIIDDILDLSKIESGRQEIAIQPCSPRQIVSDVINIMHVHADAKKLSLNWSAHESVPQQIAADPIRLRQILMNLVGNAIKFTETGGVQITVRWEHNTDQFCKLRFDIRDTGIGMSEEQIEHIFHPFTQADTSFHRRFGGTGLGLAISQRLTRLMGGDIAVASAPGVGSVFTITVAASPIEAPAQKETPDECSQTDHPAAKSYQLNGRILLAEDGPDNQRLICTLLRKAGAEIVCVENGKLALDLAIKEQNAGKPFELVIMDMQMPVMDGYEAVQKLRETGYHHPIVALTAHAMKDDRAKCLEAGCDDYFSKPIDRDILLGAVQKYLPKRSPVDYGRLVAQD